MTLPDTRLPDRRERLKQANRRAIIEAAVSLIGERGLAGLTVDELASRADVSRRTVFNHFNSLDEIIPAAFSDVLGGVVDSFTQAAAVMPVGERTAASMFGEIAAVLRTIDLVTPVSRLMRILYAVEDHDPRRAQWVDEALRGTSDGLAREVRLRHADADPLAVDILVSSLINSLGVVSDHWLARTGARDDAASRAVWSELMERALAIVEKGYAASSDTPENAVRSGPDGKENGVG